MDVLGVDGPNDDGGVEVPVEVRACPVAVVPFVLIGVTGAGGASGRSDFFCGGVDGSAAGLGSAAGAGAGTGASS